jgi:hypothetical protein
MFSPVEYAEDFDVARDIFDWDSFNEDMNSIEEINFENYV